jgi:hypothetical protein
MSRTLHPWNAISESLPWKRGGPALSVQPAAGAGVGAPEVFCRLPVQLLWTQPACEIVGLSVCGIQLVGQAH